MATQLKTKKLVPYVWLCIYGYVFMAMYIIWLCMYGYVCMAMYVCVYVCMHVSMHVRLCEEWRCTDPCMEL